MKSNVYTGPDQINAAYYPEERSAFLTPCVRCGGETFHHESK